MKTCMYRFVLTAVCAACFSAVALAQGPAGIAFEYDSTASYDVETGQAVVLRMRACDERKGTVENWDNIGKDVTLTVRGSFAETDTSVRSWNRRFRAFTWIHIKAGDTVLSLDSIRFVDTTPLLYYTIPKAVFVKGHATLAFSQSRADSGIVISLAPRWSFLQQDSPNITMRPGPPDNFLVEITTHTANTNEVYWLRRYEIVVTPRDRYLNPQLDSTISVLFSARFPNEFDLNQPAIDDVFSGPVTVHGLTPFMVASRIPRPDSTYYQNRAAQWVAVRSIPDSAISGQSDEYSIIHHAPNPFSLQSPEDQKLFKLEGSTTEEVFTWEEPQPKDPYNNIRISRFDSTNFDSDEVRYKIRIVDATTLTRAVEYASDDRGRYPRWTTRHHVLYSIINQLSGLPTTRRQDMVWYVEATDGLYMTQSRPPSEQRPGFRMTVDKYMYHEVPDAVEEIPQSPTIALHPNYPNPFNPGTVIPVELLASSYCRLQVRDLMGNEVAVLHNGFLEAGTHRFTFDGRELPSGVYTYCIIIDGVTRTRSMLLLR